MAGVIASAFAGSYPLVVSGALTLLSVAFVLVMARREEHAEAPLMKAKAVPPVKRIGKLDRTVDAGRRAGPTGEELKCLQFLASGEVNYSAKEVAAHLSVSEQKAQYYLDQLLRHGEAEYFVNPYRETSWSRVVLSVKGRKILVKQGLL